MEIKEVLETGLILTAGTWTIFGIYDKFISKSLATSSINDSPFKSNSTVDGRKKMAYNSDNGIIGETNNSIPSLIPPQVPEQNFMPLDMEVEYPEENNEQPIDESLPLFESFIGGNEIQDDDDNNHSELSDQHLLENYEAIEFLEPVRDQFEEEPQDLPEFVEVFENFDSDYTSDETVDLAQLNEYNPYLTTADYSIEAI